MTTLDDAFDLIGGDDGSEDFSDDYDEDFSDSHSSTSEFLQQAQRHSTREMLHMDHHSHDTEFCAPHTEHVFLNGGVPETYSMPAVLRERTPSMTPVAKFGSFSDDEADSSGSHQRHQLCRNNSSLSTGGVGPNGVTLTGVDDSDSLDDNVSLAPSFVEEVDAEPHDCAAVALQMRQLVLSSGKSTLQAAPNEEVQEKLTKFAPSESSACVDDVSLLSPIRGGDGGVDTNLLNKYRDWWRSELEGGGEEDAKKLRSPGAVNVPLSKETTNAFVSAHFSALAAMATQDSLADNGVELQALRFLSSRHQNRQRRPSIGSGQLANGASVSDESLSPTPQQQQQPKSPTSPPMSRQQSVRHYGTTDGTEVRLIPPRMQMAHFSPSAPASMAAAGKRGPSQFGHRDSTDSGSNDGSDDWSSFPPPNPLGSPVRAVRTLHSPRQHLAVPHVPRTGPNSLNGSFDRRPEGFPGFCGAAPDGFHNEASSCATPPYSRGQSTTFLTLPPATGMTRENSGIHSVITSPRAPSGVTSPRAQSVVTSPAPTTLQPPPLPSTSVRSSSRPGILRRFFGTGRTSSTKPPPLRVVTTDGEASLAASHSNMTSPPSELPTITSSGHITSAERRRGK